MVLSWNSREFIEACLAGLRRHEPASPVYVVDNGSSDGSPDVLATAHPEVTLIKLPANLGFAGGSNVGVARALADGCEAVALVNNDTVIDEPFIDACIRVLDEHPEIGIVGPVIVDAGDRTVFQCRGGRVGLWTLTLPIWARASGTSDATATTRSTPSSNRRELEATGGSTPNLPAPVQEADSLPRRRPLSVGGLPRCASPARRRGSRRHPGFVPRFTLVNRFGSA